MFISLFTGLMVQRSDTSFIFGSGSAVYSTDRVLAQNLQLRFETLHSMECCVRKIYVRFVESSSIFLSFNLQFQFIQRWSAGAIIREELQ